LLAIYGLHHTISHGLSVHVYVHIWALYNYEYHSYCADSNLTP
jgi:hypothetical protein